MPIEIKIKGIEKLDSVSEYYKTAEGILRKLLKQATINFGVDSQRNIMKNYLSGPRPEKLDVISNRLRSSITYRVDDSEDISITFGTDVPYAPIHEFGLGIRARPFITPGVMDMIPKFKENIDEIVQRVANGKPYG